MFYIYHQLQKGKKGIPSTGHKEAKSGVWKGGWLVILLCWNADAEYIIGDKVGKVGWGRIVEALKFIHHANVLDIIRVFEVYLFIQQESDRFKAELGED